MNKKIDELDILLENITARHYQISDLSKPQLKKLADLLRERIIKVTSLVGGHLASSLGTVELTVALYYVFNIAKNKIIWDVGHQAYSHKILTGRNKVFEKIGMEDGIAKFLSRDESEYDYFGAGHASTSISAALGFLVAGELNNQNGKTIAIMGDGALTGGLAYESINLTGCLQKDMIVVLNDNEMSIDKNIGIFYKHQTNGLGNLVQKTLAAIRGKINNQTAIPIAVASFVKKLANRFNKKFIKTRRWFEALGFEYLGPIDGHNIDALIKTFKQAKDFKKPVLIHVLTIKGKGYIPAEKDAFTYHGVTPFEADTGLFVKKQKTGITFTEIWQKTITKIFEQDEKVVSISAAMIGSTGLSDLINKYPNRVFDAGIAEANAVCFAGGLAAANIKPFVAIYSTFLQRAFDQLIHDIGLQKLPVKFILDRSGFVGADGATHHGAFDMSYLAMIPNFVIMSPKDGKDLVKMIYTAYMYNQGPVAVRYPRGETNSCFSQLELDQLDIAQNTIKIGTSNFLTTGNDGAIISIGVLAEYALEVASLLAEKGLKIAVLDARFLKPLDKPTIGELAKLVPWVVTLEENSKIGGFGSLVTQFFEDSNIKTPIINLGIPDNFISHGNIPAQRKKAGLSVNSILETINQRFLKSTNK